MASARHHSMRRFFRLFLRPVCALPDRTPNHTFLKSSGDGAFPANFIVVSKILASAFRWASVSVCRSNVVCRRDPGPLLHCARSVCSPAAQHTTQPSPVLQWTSHVKRGSHAMQDKVRHLFFLAKNMHCKQEQVPSEECCTCSSSISSSYNAIRSSRQAVA